MIDIITDDTALRRLQGPWNALASQSADPFQRHECAMACIEAFSAMGRPVVYTLRQRGELRAVAAFRAVRRVGVSRLEVLTRPLSEPTGILHTDEAALSELVDAVLDSRRPLMLGRLTQSGAELRAFDRCLHDRPPLSTSSRTDRSVWVPLPSDPEALDATLSANRRRDLRRKRRRADERGTVAFSSVQPDASSAAAVLEDAYRIEATGWKGRNGTALLMAPDFRHFYDTFCTALAREGRLFVFFLGIGQDLAAMRVCAEHGGRLWELKIGYDERFDDCSPGFLLTHEVLRWSCQRGLTAYEFLGQAEAWEYAWKSEPRDYCSVNIHPRTLSGGFSLTQDAGWTAAKAALRRIRMDRGARKARARQAGAVAPATKS